MAILSPFYGLILPFLFIFTIPIAIFASITTTLAFSLLFCRVLVVYIELAFAVIPYWVLGVRTSTKTFESSAKTLSNSSNSPTTVTTRRRKRRSSSSSAVSATGSITPVQFENGMGLSQSVGPTRDFEGVGGWRLDNNPSDDDALWTHFNSRLELPADHIRRHHRSLTSGSTPGEMSRGHGTFSPEAMMNTSRARTPPSTGIGMEGYFGGHVPISPARGKRVTSAHTANSGSSGSSKGSSVLSMKAR